MTQWYLYLEKFNEIEVISTDQYFKPYDIFRIKDTNLCYGPLNVIRNFEDTKHLHLSILYKYDYLSYFYIEDIVTKLTEDEVYQRALDLYGYLRLKYGT